MENKPAKNKIHGSIVSSRLSFVENRWGKAARQKLINQLPLKEKRVFESSVFENNWFETATLELFDKIILEEFAEGQYSILHELGKYSAEVNYRRLPTTIINQPPEELFKNAARINVLFQDFGELETEILPDKGEIKQIALSYHYQEPIGENYCASALGYFEKLLEQLGFAVVEVKETECQSKGGEVHRYEISWLGTRLTPKPLDKEDLPNKGLTGKLSLPNSNTNELSKVFTENKLDNFSSSDFAASVKITSQQDTSPFNWRVATLIVLIVISLGIVIIQFFFSSPTPQPTTTDKIYGYDCKGVLAAKIKVDKPYLLVTSPEELINANISLEDKGKKYFLKIKKLNANTLIELSLGEFLSSENKPLDPETLPNSVSLAGEVKGQNQNCDCKLSDGKN